MESAAAAAASGVVALPAAPASQPPPTTIFVQVGRHEWEDFPVSPGTLGLMRGGFIQLLLSRSTLAPLVNALPPPHEVFAVKRILSADRDFPEVDDEVADNLVKIDKRVTLGNAASQRHTGADLFILVRSSAYAGVPAAIAAATGGAGTGAGDGALAAPTGRMALVHREELVPPSARGTHLLTEAASVSTRLVWNWPHKQWHEAAAVFETFATVSGLRLDSDKALVLNRSDGEDMFREKTWHRTARAMIHDWCDFTNPAGADAQQTIGAMFGADFQAHLGGPRLPTGAIPEIPCKVKTRGAGNPGSVYEIKSSGDGNLWEQVLVCGCADISFSYFQPMPHESAIGDLFWPHPPVAYSLCVTSPTAWIAAVELAGRAYVTPISRPSWVEDPVLVEAWRGLPQAPAGDASKRLVVGAGGATWLTQRRNVIGDPVPVKPTGDQLRATCRPDSVQWTTSSHVDANGSWFLKVFGWRFHSTSEARALVRTYAQLSAAVRDSSDACPKTVHAATLWFGYFCMLVRAPFLDGYRQARDADVTVAVHADVAEAIAEALVWLLWHDLLYIDLRGPNVMLPPATASAGTPAAVLVDFDDTVHIPGLRGELEAAGTVQAAKAVLRSKLHGMSYAKDFACPGTFPTVAAAVTKQLVKRGLIDAASSPAASGSAVVAGCA